MRLLDLFCGAGGAAMGYHRAGFDEIVGVDNHPQKRYPFSFVLGDALEYCAEHGREFDAIHASPPCQAYTEMQKIHKNSKSHPDLLVPTRQAIENTSLPYVIENVKGAPLVSAIMLCGTMFGLRIVRHRYFECPWMGHVLLNPCDHSDVYDPWHGAGRTADKMRAAMGIDWMPHGGGNHKSGTIDNAIPPAYTEYIGRLLLEFIGDGP